HRVKRSRPDVVAVAAQLLHHLHPEYRLLRGVVKHVHPHEPAEKHLGQQLAHSFRTPILTLNINPMRMVKQVQQQYCSSALKSVDGTATIDARGHVAGSRPHRSTTMR